tara:strand:- start:990 stop:1202 length:213 start_codon:yes stop_codon:yes gene_type:complete
MKFDIGHKDMEIILDALETLHKDMTHANNNGFSLTNYSRGYTLEDVDGLFQSFDNFTDDSLLNDVLEDKI